MAPSSELEGAVDWSSTHHRLRTELFVCAVLIATFAWFGADLNTLPFTGTHLVNPAPKVAVLGALYAMFFYFLCALWFRTRVENLRRTPPDRLFKSTEDTLLSRLNAAPPVLGVNARSVDTLGKRLSEFEATLESLKAPALLKEQVGPIDWNVGVDEVEEDVRKAAREMMPGFRTFEADEKEARLRLAVPVAFAIRNKALAVDKERSALAEKASGPQLEIVKSEILGLRAQLDESQKEIQATAAHYLSELEQSQATLRTEIRKIRGAIIGIRSDLQVEQNFFSLWAPIVGSVIIAYSHPAYSFVAWAIPSL